MNRQFSAITLQNYFFFIERFQWRTVFRNSNCSFHQHPHALYNILTRIRKMLMCSLLSKINEPNMMRSEKES